MLTITLVMMVFCTTINVFATDVTLNNTLGDVLYDYTSDDLLSIPNYIDYFSVPADKLYLKYDAQYQRLTNNDTTEFGYYFWTNIKLYWDGNTSTGLKQIEFPEHEGYKLFYWWYTGRGYTCQTLVVDTQGIPVLINGRLACTDQFDLYYNQYLVSSDFTSYSLYPNQSSYSGVVNGTQNGNYYYFNLDLNRQCMYSEIPYLMSFYDDNNYPDGDFLSQAPYYYDNFVKVLDAYYNNTDDTGYVVDRRTSKMINPSGSGVQPSQYGFKQGSFGNILYGGDLENQKLMVAYELNDPSSTIANDLYLKLNYRYLFDGLVVSQDIIFDEDYYTNTGVYDMYSLNNNNYVNVDLSKVFDSLWEDDGNYADNLGIALTDWGGVATGRSYPQKVMDKSATFLFRKLSDENLLVCNPVSVEWDNSFFDSVSLTYKNVTVSPKINLTSIISGTSSGSYVNRLDDVELIVTESIYNASTGEESSPYTFIYNYLTNTYSELGTLETSGELFDGSYDYGGQSLSSYTSDDINFDIAKGQYYPSSNNSAYGGQGYGGNASVGNITIGAGDTIVDLTTDEWLAHSPNYNDLITTLKNGITAVSEDSGSVTALLTETYTVFPVPIWGYLTLAIATISALAVIRYIRRG